MSKQMIESFTKAQYKALGASDNKERLSYMIAGCKDGRLFSYDGTDYGMFNEDAPDTVFIPESDLELSRITGSKIATITLKMQKFFAAYGANGVAPDKNEIEDYEIEDEDEDEDEVEVEAPVKEKKKDKKAKDEDDEKQKDKDEEDETADVEDVEKAIKKAIKKGKLKKAQKLIDKLGGHKKLQKKLDEVK